MGSHSEHETIYATKPEIKWEIELWFLKNLINKNVQNGQTGSAYSVRMQTCSRKKQKPIQ